MEKKTIVVVGAGKGLGYHVAERFGKEGFRVVLMARNGKSLEAYRQELSDECVETYVYTADAEQPNTLAAALEQVKQQFGTPDVLIYNVGITTPDEPGRMDSAELMRHYQVDVASAYTCVNAVLTDEFARKNGAIFLTGGGLALFPNVAYLPLSLDKAAIRALAIALHNEWRPKGVYVGTVTVCGAIGGSEYFDPARIAETYWQMYQQRSECETVYSDPNNKWG